MRIYSQREARRLAQRVRELQDIQDKQRDRWATQWPDGIFIRELGFDANDPLLVSISTARKLGFPVLVTVQGSRIVFFAVSPTSQK